jgi:hypothetical protein
MNDSELYGFGFEGVTFGYASMDSTTPAALLAPLPVVHWTASTRQR